MNTKMYPNANGSVVLRCWRDLVNHYDMIELAAFAVMPNHFHDILFFNEAAAGEKIRSLSTVIGSFKSYSARRINERLDRLGVPVWQTSFYDRIIRKEDELYKFRRYIIANPLRWSLKHDKQYR